MTNAEARKALSQMDAAIPTPPTERDAVLWECAATSALVAMLRDRTEKNRLAWEGAVADWGRACNDLADAKRRIETLETLLAASQALCEEYRLQRGPGRKDTCFCCVRPFWIYPGDMARHTTPRGGAPLCPTCWERGGVLQAPARVAFSEEERL